MATKADRGTKRTCQDASCAVRFYDLARDPIKCPTCGALYQIVVSPPVAERRPSKRGRHSYPWLLSQPRRMPCSKKLALMWP